MKIHSREYWKAMLPIVTAFAEGREILCDGIRTIYNPHFDCLPDRYEIIPATHTVNGFEVPAPETEAIEESIHYYFPEPSSEYYYGGSYWDGGSVDEYRLERGLIHLTKEAAIANAKAMCGIDPRVEI